MTTTEQVQIETKSTEIVDLLKKHKAEIDLGLQQSALDTKSQIDNAVNGFQDEIRAIRSNMHPLEQKASNQLGDNLAVQTKAFFEKANGVQASHSFELVPKGINVKAVTQSSGLLANVNSPDTRVNPIDIRAGIEYEPLRKEHIRDIMSAFSTDKDMYQWNFLKTYTDATSIKGEGQAFLGSDAKFEPRSTTFYKILSGMVMSRELIDDNPQLQQFLANQLSLYYYFEEDRMLARGTGANGEPVGFFTDAIAFAPNAARKVPNPDLIRLYRNAGLQVAIKNFQASACFMSLGTEMDIDLMQDNNGRYQDTKPLLPYDRFTSTFIGDDEFVVADANKGGFIIDRTGLDLQYSFEDNDNFSKDMITIRLSKRLAPVKLYSNAFVKGTIAAGLVALKSV